MCLNMAPFFRNHSALEMTSATHQTVFRKFLCFFLAMTVGLGPTASALAQAAQYRIPLQVGEGPSQLLVSPDPVDFGDVARTQLETQPITLHNAGSSTVTGLSASVAEPFFMDTRGCVNLAAGASCTMAASFLPDAAGPASALMT